MSLEPSDPHEPATLLDAPREAARQLERRLLELESDRAATARAVAAEAARELHAWALGRPADWGAAAAARDLEWGWRGWREAHAWRGACARLVDEVRRALAGASAPRAALLAETRAWLEEPEAGSPRLVPCERLAPFAAATLGRGDVIAVLGYSEHSARALAAAQRAGLEPRVLVGEMASDQSGKRLARELLAHGVQVRVTWDLALLAAVEEADHVWLGCEAAGAGRFIAHRGAALLLERARAAEVPSRGLATASDLLPGGELELPAWGARETDDLWCFAPEGVELDAQPYELVDADRVDAWTTDAGCEAFADLCVRALRSEVAPSLTAVR